MISGLLLVAFWAVRTLRQIGFNLIANIALSHMYPVTCIDVIESAAEVRYAHQMTAFALDILNFWCYYYKTKKTGRFQNCVEIVKCLN